MNASGNGRHQAAAVPTIEERFPRLSAAELLEAGQRQPDWLVGGVLVANQPMVICGAEKTLKTAVAIDLGLSLVSGAPFLGRYAVARRVNVGMMSGESGAMTLGETAVRIAAAKGIDLRDYADSYGTYTTLPMLTRGADLEAVEHIVARDALGCIIIDPAYLCMDLDGRE
ncbi:MAG TPA: AAA family ATPase, partial [Pirellulales bacterium]|nr:AAA family ATPase [Pirellulales bacterium]